MRSSEFQKMLLPFLRNVLNFHLSGSQTFTLTQVCFGTCLWGSGINCSSVIHCYTADKCGEKMRWADQEGWRGIQAVKLMDKETKEHLLQRGKALLREADIIFIALIPLFIYFSGSLTCVISLLHYRNSSVSYFLSSTLLPLLHPSPHLPLSSLLFIFFFLPFCLPPRCLFSFHLHYICIHASHSSFISSHPHPLLGPFAQFSFFPPFLLTRKSKSRFVQWTRRRKHYQ